MVLTWSKLVSLMEKCLLWCVEWSESLDLELYGLGCAGTLSTLPQSESLCDQLPLPLPPSYNIYFIDLLLNGYIQEDKVKDANQINTYKIVSWLLISKEFWTPKAILLEIFTCYLSCQIDSTSLTIKWEDIKDLWFMCSVFVLLEIFSMEKKPWKGQIQLI